ncbi:hypothetical protein [Rhodoferax sp.]|uniref:hypothetical protein n=1 Tax=Rhodoferax sp. TaxID=50421 RepID=UPI00272EED72|nr:hypothetical protein [Rhodoferax sp.]MDP1531930.1 hypothetical protein [Rhodoferax sp.]MDP1945845.1 hypothetical protein [Rhodoferax sp.]MDP2443414.1 hypothetical protein [Rhodoferax sp.]MDZ4207099.1 hypothetical protein [Rhodoferax sp.]
MRASAFIFGTDLLDEGHATVLDNLQQRGGLDSVSFSASYHDARDVFPHNPRRHVFRNEGDVTWFPVDPSHYASGLVPRQALAAEGADVLADLCQRAQARGMAVTAWTIFTHNSVLATAHPDCATRNVYGDPYLTDLCPANPRVRSYCCELAADVVRRPVQRLLAESLHYRPLEHGEHHERYLIPLPLEARALMSLCFCTHCRSAATDAGVDVPALAAAMRAALQPVWDGTVLPGQVLLAEAARDALKQYVAVRCATVTSLVAEVRQAIAPSGVPLTFVDHAGTMAHVMHGVVADDDVLSASRRLGIDPVAIAAVADELCVLGYQDTPERVAAVLTRYREALGPQARLSVALRPLLPDCRDEANLRQKIRHAVQAGVDGIEFYHYAMMPLNRLDWIRQGLAAAGDLP